MLDLDARVWKAVSPLLDRALDLDAEARRRFLAEVNTRDPVTGAALAKLLHAHEDLSTSDFLESAPTVPIAPAVGGLTVGPYTLEEPIGAGGTGVVWRARRSDGRFEAAVAVKLLQLSALSPASAARFTREGTLLARLSHANVARLFDAGITPTGQPYLVLELIDGTRIDQYADTHRLSIAARLQLFLQVCDAVAHAHAHLVVHRDLKPSNILVDREGAVKLLDFGVASLMAPDGSEAITLSAARGFTPEYAAPEQLARGPVTTATDVYALGTILHHLLIGAAPADRSARSEHATADPSMALDAVPIVAALNALDTNARGAIAEARSTTAEKLRQAVSGDLDTITRKAIAPDPVRRYATATSLADDVRRYLRHEPIAARPDRWAYRAGKFVRRHRVAVTVAAAIAIGAASALYLVNRERALAQHRFLQVRQLATELLNIDTLVRELPGSTRTRQTIVNAALTYLQNVMGEAESDPDFSLELGTAFMRVARVQGVPIAVNLGKPDEAEKNLVTAKQLVENTLRQQPGHEMALLRMAQIAHDRMILAGLRRPDSEALPLARESAGWLERLLATSPALDEFALEQVLIALNNVGNRFRIAREFDRASALVERGIALANQAETLNARLQGGSLLLGLSRIHRDSGALEKALATIRQAQQQVGPPPDASVGRAMAYSLMLSTEAQLLDQPRGLTLNRPGESVAPLQRGFDLLDPLVHRDAADSELRFRLGSIGLLLGDALAAADPQRALEVYDHVLRHLAEVKTNPRARRDEIRVLASSSRVLNQLRRFDDADRRLVMAFDLLRAAKAYPSDRIEFGSEADAALSAQGDDHLAHGRISEAIATYRTLLDKATASDPDVSNDLSDASDWSRVVTTLAGLHENAGEVDSARALTAERDALWTRWNEKIPGNPFVARHLVPAQPVTRP